MKIRGNDPCPCQSGRKYKKCCGAEPPPGKLHFPPGDPDEVMAKVIAYAQPLLETDEDDDPEGLLVVALSFFTAASNHSLEEFLRVTEPMIPPGLDDAGRAQILVFHRKMYDLHLAMFPELHKDQGLGVIGR